LTEQFSLVDLDYWASGLTRVYLERAFARSQRTPPPSVARLKGNDRPHFQTPAPEQSEAAEFALSNGRRGRSKMSN